MFASGVPNSGEKFRCKVAKERSGSRGANDRPPAREPGAGGNNGNGQRTGVRHEPGPWRGMRNIGSRPTGCGRRQRIGPGRATRRRCSAVRRSGRPIRSLSNPIFAGGCRNGIRKLRAAGGIAGKTAFVGKIVNLVLAIRTPRGNLWRVSHSQRPPGLIRSPLVPGLRECRTACRFAGRCRCHFDTSRRNPRFRLKFPRGQLGPKGLRPTPPRAGIHPPAGSHVPPRSARP